MNNTLPTKSFAYENLIVSTGRASGEPTLLINSIFRRAISDQHEYYGRNRKKTSVITGILNAS